MPIITLTLSDTPEGQVAIHSSFKPAVGQPCSHAQGFALEIVALTRKQWGTPMAPMDGVDIDAVHRAREFCHCDLEWVPPARDTGRCMTCGKARP